MPTSTRADLLRPIFAVEGFEAIDETCTHGAYIGGMAAASDDAGIATSYMKAADALVELGIKDDCVHEVILPALFLYRHTLELRLKVAVPPTKPNHSLGELVRALDGLLRSKGGAGLAPGIVDRIDEIAKLDRRADAFRFTRALKDGRPAGRHFPEEVWVNLAHLRNLMARIDAELLAATDSRA